MLRRATLLLAFLALPFAVHGQTVFDVTLKEAFDVSADSLQKAKNLGDALTRNTFNDLTRSPFTDITNLRSGCNESAVDTLIRFTAVLLSDPLNSGNASANNGAAPNRVQVFVRDTSAVGDSGIMAGYGGHVVDGDYQNSGLLSLAPGAVITVTGSICYFSGTPQISPTSLSVVTTDYRSLGLPDEILDPINVTVADLNGPGVPSASSTNEQSTINFDTYTTYSQEYVRVEGVTITSSSESTGNFAGRFNITFTDPATNRSTSFLDLSHRFRNDRIGNEGYTGLGFNVRTDEYVLPPEGTRVNLTGYMLYGDFDAANFFNPNMHLRIAPFEDSDIEILGDPPPSLSSVSAPEGLVTGTTDVTITANAVAGGSRTLASVALLAGAPGETPTSYPMTLTSGTEFTGTIPASALNDGDFVVYFVRATDSQGDNTDSDMQSFRVLTTIDAIADIQTTANGMPGPSPLRGIEVDATSGLMDLVVTIMTDADSTNLFAAQDGTDPWSGIALRPSDELRALEMGTQIRITGALISEFNDVTQLESLTFEALTCTADCGPYAPVEVTTTMLADPGTAEAHESMMLRFNDVEIVSTNADGPSSNFGEWLFQTVGTTDALRGDDQSRGIPRGFNDDLVVGDKYAFIQGLWSYSFGNYKLFPQFLSDLALSTAALPGELPEGFALGQSFPNPSTGVTTIPFSLENAGHVTLEVFDTLGRRVARLVDAPRPAGAQAASFDTAALSAGLYVYRLTAGTRTTSATLVVVR